MATAVSHAHIGMLQQLAELDSSAAWRVLLLKRPSVGVLQATPVDVFVDYTTVADVLAEHDEADFDSYERKTLVNLTSERDNGEWVIDADNQITWSEAGEGNVLDKVIVFHDPDPATSSDSDRLFLLAFDINLSTNGRDLTVRLHDGGLCRYSQ